MSDKPRVHGIGGVFFRADDPQAIGEWYRRHLDFELEPWGGVNFRWRREDRDGICHTVWSPFPRDTRYFEPGTSEFMLNLRVDDLDAVLGALRAEGCQVLDRREDSEYGRFGYVVDPEGRVVELWQPPESMPAADAASE
jgi:catechol 2,3-dioxygenase-like lactoylglutathione lyase family enzyme